MSSPGDANLLRLRGFPCGIPMVAHIGRCTFCRCSRLLDGLPGGTVIPATTVMDMARIVLRVRLTGGDQLDVTYEKPGTGSEDETIEYVVTTLAQERGMLRCSHGDRLVVLYARGVAALEVAPRGAVV